MSLSRRDFLKLAGLSLAGLGFQSGQQDGSRFLPGEPVPLPMLGRVTRSSEPVYSQPDHASPRLSKLPRDNVIQLLEVIVSPNGPETNPRWYRLEQGYIHSAYIQRVNSWQNEPLTQIPPTGRLGEISVPFTQVQYLTRQGHWVPLYRLYFGTVHWITGVEEDRAGKIFYRLTDDWLRIQYLAPAEHIRPLEAEEFSPLVPGIPAEEKRLEVSLERQVVTAYQGWEAIREFPVSTGKRYTPTHPGLFSIDRKHPSRHMGDGGITSDPRAYELVGVPWVSFFQTSGIAFHGTFWHDNFGVPMSNGCVNMRNEDARWLFRWSAPHYKEESQDRPTWKITARGGTDVSVS